MQESAFVSFVFFFSFFLFFFHWYTVALITFLLTWQCFSRKLLPDAHAIIFIRRTIQSFSYDIADNASFCLLELATSIQRHVRPTIIVFSMQMYFFFFTPQKNSQKLFCTNAEKIFNPFLSSHSKQITQKESTFFLSFFFSIWKKFVEQNVFILIAVFLQSCANVFVCCYFSRLF